MSYLTFTGIEAVKPTYYEVVDADTEHDAYPSVYRVLARPGFGDEWAQDAEQAAEVWAEHRHADHDYPDEMRAVVTDPDGKKWRVTVKVEVVPAFHGYAEEIE
jgi:hypothetical protein